MGLCWDLRASLQQQIMQVSSTATTHAYTVNLTSNICAVISEFQKKSFKCYHTKLNLNICGVISEFQKKSFKCYHTKLNLNISGVISEFKKKIIQVLSYQTQPEIVRY